MRKYFLLTMVFLFAFVGISFAEISKITVSNALKRIAKVGSFDRVPIKFEKDDVPDAWLEFEDNGNFDVHVTRGLMRILDNEGEIAGVLGHVIGHVQLGHYNTALQSNA
ncbi:MAG: M48 family metalloprotease, partial [Synergistaceae bacterium]|nr:M48 family metalloprotease [Synergistaceae bacterium]